MGFFSSLKTIRLAGAMGFCAGVRRALYKIEQASHCKDSSLFLTHAIIHNEDVHQRLIEAGIRAVEHISNVPAGATWVISAHGISPQQRALALQRNVNIIDATCPLILKTHQQIIRLGKKNVELIILGHPLHVEIIGLRGRAEAENMFVTVLNSIEDIRQFTPKSTLPLAFVTQTTLSEKSFQTMYTHLRAKFPKIQGPEKGDICYATVYRQRALQELLEKVEAVIILGSSSSSNANKLLQLAQTKRPSCLIRGFKYLDLHFLNNISHLGITAAASTPDWIIEEVLNGLRSWNAREFELIQERAQYPEPFIFDAKEIIL